MTAPTPTVVVTGAGGFFGWHLLCRLRAMQPDWEVKTLDHGDFASDETLICALAEADAVVHLGGVNRGAGPVVREQNVALAERLVWGLGMAGGSPRVIYANSIHARGDSPYGEGKRIAAETLRRWCDRAGSPFDDLLFCNLFGECGRPHYNSAVATFCADLAEGAPSRVDPAGRTQLLHVQDACAVVIGAVGWGGPGGSRTVGGEDIAVPEVYERLRRLAREYRGARVPDLADRLDLLLFNQLRTAMFPVAYPFRLDRHVDTRGLFAECARGFGTTQASFSTTKPGVSRGDHFHFEKFERFVVLSGSAVIRVRRVLTDEVVEFAVHGESPVAVDMPPLHAHSITNTGRDELVALFWANDHFDPASPDTYHEPVVCGGVTRTRSGSPFQPAVESCDVEPAGALR